MEFRNAKNGKKVELRKGSKNFSQNFCNLLQPFLVDGIKRGQSLAVDVQYADDVFTFQ